MIIKPKTKEESDIPFITKGWDLNGDYILKDKTVLSKDNKSFIRTIIKYSDKNISKQTYTGSMINGICISDNFSNIEINKSGYEINDYNLIVSNPINDGIYNINQKFYYDKPIRFQPSNIINSNNEFINKNDSIDLFIDEIHNIEDMYQLSYNEFIGLIKTFFNSCLWSFPLDAYITIDCKRGCFNINQFKIIKLDEELMNSQYINMMNSISRLTELLHCVCEKNKRNITIFAFIGNSESIVKLIDNDRITQEMFYIINTDLGNALIKNSINGGLNFIGSEEYDFIENNELISKNDERKIINKIVDKTFFDTIDYCNERRI